MARLINKFLLLASIILNVLFREFTAVSAINNTNIETINIFNEINGAISPFNVLTMYGNIITSTVQRSNDECSRQLKTFQNAIKTYEPWALKMLDASSKMPSGILQGNLKDIGMYDECVAVRMVKNNITIQGRHCMYTIAVSVSSENLTVSPTLSVCLPAACDEVPLQQILQLAIDNIKNLAYLNLNIEVRSVFCLSITTELWSIGGIITIMIFGINVTFLILCTTCDIYIRVNYSLANEYNKYMNVLRQFSLYTNGKRILSTKIQHENLPALCGLRFYSMCWVMLGHTYFIVLSEGVINAADLTPWMQSWKSLYVLDAPLAVDTFFVLSGVLVSYFFLKAMKSAKFNLLLYYIHRYIRLTPALAALLLLCIYILPYLGSGPMWQQHMYYHRDQCALSWWRALLYVQNLRDPADLACLGYLWYLAVDMQLYLISPLILYPLAKRPKIGIAILSSLIVSSIIVPAVIFYLRGYQWKLMFVISGAAADFTFNYYITTYIRAGPWLLGILLGYILQTKKYRPTSNVVRFGWLFTAIALIFSILCWRIFQHETYTFDVYWEIFYTALGRHIWSAAICWIIYASALGHGGIISKCLSMPILLPFSRISYAVYLLHFVIQTMKITSLRYTLYFSNFEMISIFLSDLIMCILGGFVFTLLFQSPFLVLEKMLLSSKKVTSNGTPQV